MHTLNPGIQDHQFSNSNNEVIGVVYGGIEKLVLNIIVPYTFTPQIKDFIQKHIEQ